MLELSEQLGAKNRELQRPMRLLREEGKVRVVGKRHMMRYYPAVARAGKE
jgi:transcription initiation factor IIE alpha subunit